MSDKKKPGDGDHKVGYRRPPKETQFKSGQSGNPTGRPKGSQNFHTVLEQALNEKVTINENGIRKVVTKKEAVAKLYVKTALSSGGKFPWKDFVEIVTATEKKSAASKVHKRIENLTDEELMEIASQGRAKNKRSRVRLTMTRGSKGPARCANENESPCLWVDDDCPYADCAALAEGIEPEPNNS